MPKPLILVTNDDGMLASGLAALVSVARDLGDVVVVAPSSPQSGMGHAITIFDPIRLREVNTFPGIPAYECSGTPVDCVKLAKTVILKNREIDLCVSGINHGSNASINIIYSGTLSAAMEASLEGIPSIGFSLLDFDANANFAPGLPYAQRICKYVLDRGIPNGDLLNVNIPNLPENEIQGMLFCRQGDARWVEEYSEKADPRGQKYYWLTGEFVSEDDGKDTDIWALDNGYISIVPSGHDLTNFASLDKLKHLEEKL